MNALRTTIKPATLLRQALVLGCAGISMAAGAAQALDDSVLSEVQGRDGVSFASNLNVKVGSSSYTVDNNLGQPTSLIHSNVVTTGLYAFKLDISPGGVGAPDVLTWSYPEITSNKPLGIAYDLSVNADGLTLGTGVTLQNVLLGGSSMQLSSSSLGGMAFGMANKLNITSMLLQPNGRGNTAGQMGFTGVNELGAIDIRSAVTGNAWVLADLVKQPGQFNILADAGGDRIQIGIDFPKVGEADEGRLNIGNISFTPISGAPVNLGSSSIGSMQIQHLNIKFRAP